MQYYFQNAVKMTIKLEFCILPNHLLNKEEKTYFKQTKVECIIQRF